MRVVRRDEEIKSILSIFGPGKDSGDEQRRWEKILLLIGCLK